VEGEAPAEERTAEATVEGKSTAEANPTSHAKAASAEPTSHSKAAPAEPTSHSKAAPAEADFDDTVTIAGRLCDTGNCSRAGKGRCSRHLTDHRNGQGGQTNRYLAHYVLTPWLSAPQPLGIKLSLSQWVAAVWHSRAERTGNIKKASLRDGFR
jgi:membrane protein involved in colicin uptake